MKSYQDSVGRPIRVGDKVRFRGRIYEIAEFQPGGGRFGSAAIRFTDKPHIDEIPDEISVDKL